jgi:hypothetical protein
MRDTPVRHGLPGGVQGLRRDLPAVERLRALNGHAGAEEIHLDLLEVKQVQDRRLAGTRLAGGGLAGTGLAGTGLAGTVRLAQQALMRHSISIKILLIRGNTA